ncbi:hypothetical protein ACFQT0_07380 [Hymenobacter humi]|uniref:Secreted protein n=1 Tax=Hymenobacter humi TaxID=1411620 RepID=A0ABW2U4B0_9BACT
MSCIICTIFSSLGVLQALGFLPKNSASLLQHVEGTRQVVRQNFQRGVLLGHELVGVAGVFLLHGHVLHRAAEQHLPVAGHGAVGPHAQPLQGPVGLLQAQQQVVLQGTLGQLREAGEGVVLVFSRQAAQ